MRRQPLEMDPVKWNNPWRRAIFYWGIVVILVPVAIFDLPYRILIQQEERDVLPQSGEFVFNIATWIWLAAIIKLIGMIH